MLESITQFDGNLLIGIQNALVADWLTPIMKAITVLGDKGIFSIVVCVLLMCFKRTRRLGILCSAAVALAFLACNVCIKPLVDRTRPWVAFEAVTRLAPDPGDSSFPSGHSNNVMALAWAMWLGTRGTFPIAWGSSQEMAAGSSSQELNLASEETLARRMKVLSVVLLVLAILVGISRLYLGMHYPTDVLCGWLCGMICATIAYFIYIKILRKRGIINE